MGNQRRYVNENYRRKPKKLLDLARDVLRRKHYSIRTEEAYIGWIVRYIHFHNKRHPKDMGVKEIEAFLTYLKMGRWFQNDLLINIERNNEVKIDPHNEKTQCHTNIFN